MSPFSNNRKDKRLESINSNKDIINPQSENLNFNFKYFDDSQQYGKHISALSKNEFEDFFNKLKDLSTNTLSFWKKQPIGSHKHTVIEFYDEFPKRSNFIQPKSTISLNLQWGRIRCSGALRICGFVLNDSNGKSSNTFYIVFYDPNHDFYLSDK